MWSTSFEFGRSSKADSFFNKHPQFADDFDALMKVARKCFKRNVQFQNRLEHVSFNLGKTCLDDFLDIALMAIHGRGPAASKLIRGLYERTVSLAYMIQNPEKAERFFRFAAIQEHRAMQPALKIFTESEFNKGVPPENSVEEIRKRYEEIKPEFQTTICKKCGKTKTQATWDVDIASMVQRLGPPYDSLYLAAYTNPNFSIHATLASAFQNEDETHATENELKEAKIMLIVSTQLLIYVLELQDKLFGLGIQQDLSRCSQRFLDMWAAEFSS